MCSKMLRLDKARQKELGDCYIILHACLCLIYLLTLFLEICFRMRKDLKFLPLGRSTLHKAGMPEIGSHLTWFLPTSRDLWNILAIH